ncbi:MAG TPA: acetate/propionate family kinase [Chlamydiales bacterium]|nr:acetate/propionate family kinase [Chlamydiales bacterium]
MDKITLSLNCGSSSIRASLFIHVPQKTPSCIWENHLKEFSSYQEAACQLLDALPQLPQAIGHRVVHGGERFIQSTWLTTQVLRELEELSLLAPLHNPPSLEGIYAAKKKFPNLPQLAVFDTAFHAHFPPFIALYPIPPDLAKRHQIRRYGFHGISHGYLWKKYTEIRPEKKEKGKVITLHLGSGASLCAIEQGISLDTTMGFTPLEGLMMATRSGSIDPAIVAYLAEKEGKSATDIVTFLNHNSGLLGVSQLSSEMEKILQVETSNPQAKLAIDMFLHCTLKGVGSLIPLLGSVDALLFSGGIGENSSILRSRLLKKLSWMGIEIDAAKNEGCTNLKPGEWREISSKGSTPEVFVIATDENQAIAEEIIAKTL